MYMKRVEFYITAMYTFLVSATTRTQVYEHLISKPGYSGQSGITLQ